MTYVTVSKQLTVFSPYSYLRKRINNLRTRYEYLMTWTIQARTIITWVITQLTQYIDKRNRSKAVVGATWVTFCLGISLLKISTKKCLNFCSSGRATRGNSLFDFMRVLVVFCIVKVKLQGNLIGSYLLNSRYCPIRRNAWYRK